MDVRPIHSEADYDWAIREVTHCFNNQPAPDTQDAGRFEVLSILIRDYEDKRFKMPDSDPVDILHFAIESMGRSQADLDDLIGRNRASEILNRIRPLTLEMIRRINAEWGIPIELLTPSYRLGGDHPPTRVK
jgi:HTH-type transcriptional regulator / antitoxin HigA